MPAFVLTSKGQEELYRVLREGGDEFLDDLTERWKKDGSFVIRKVVKEQLTGRPGLEQVTGNASRALNVKTRRTRGNVTQEFFLVKNNPAKYYLPIHDKSRTGDGTIKAKNKPFMTFKTKEGNWRRAKQVKIPIRTNILETITIVGHERRTTSVSTSLKKTFTKR